MYHTLTELQCSFLVPLQAQKFLFNIAQCLVFSVSWVPVVFYVKPTWITAIVKCLLLQITALVKFWLLQFTFLKAWRLLQITHSSQKYIKRTFFWAWKITVHENVVKYQSKTCSWWRGQTILFLYVFAEVAETFSLYCANINFTCGKIEPQPN